MECYNLLSDPNILCVYVALIQSRIKVLKYFLILVVEMCLNAAISCV